MALTNGVASRAFQSLDQLGITVSNTGTLALDSSTLDSVLNSNYSDVVGFLQNTGSFGMSLASLPSTIWGVPARLEPSLLRSPPTPARKPPTTMTSLRQNALIATQQASLTTRH